jgi:hypothetical protein
MDYGDQWWMDFSVVYSTQRLVDVMEKQTELIEKLTTQRKVQVEGISLPHFHRRMGDSVELYFDQVEHYFEAKNIKWLNLDQSKRVIAMTTSNFKGYAAAWYMLNKTNITTVDELKQKLSNEFVSPDLQESLRDRLYSLSQKNSSNLKDYSPSSVLRSCKSRTRVSWTRSPTSHVA